ncbi:MAG: hypothetical protein Q8M01_15475 [Rubrivivax sp.]|nr:hypothetical protein [Rubrivivax sp.]
MSKIDSYRMDTMNIDAHLAAFFEAAEVIVIDGTAHAQRVNPGQFEALLAGFDPGTVQRRLVIDFEPGGLRRIALQIGDADRAVQVFQTTVQGPTDVATAH